MKQHFNEATESSKLRNSRYSKKKIISLLGFVSGVLLSISIPYFQIGVVYNLWSKYTRNVSRDSCTCSCWDTKFKGTYESGIAAYKHVYINATGNSLKIWIITVLGACLLTECIRKIIKLSSKNRLRPTLALLFFLNIYPNYYSWWGFINYWNDDYYHQWNHQLLFASTELISTATVVHFLDQRITLKPWHLIIILDIAVMHCLCALTDQFSYNVLRAKGELHQVLRDIGFMIPDIFHICIPLKELKILAKQQHLPQSFPNSKMLFFISICSVVFVWILNIYL